MSLATPIITSETMAPLSDCYMRIEFIEWLRASGITLIDLLSSYALARKGSKEAAAAMLGEMGFFSIPWEDGFKKWLLDYPLPERIPAAMEFEYIELLGEIIKASYKHRIS
jgi:hypothetical protein